MDPMLEYQAELLSQKVKHYLITTMGRTAEEANSDEFYRAFCYALREEAMINWLASYRTFVQKDSRMLYYLSMEYLPGRMLMNNITNIHALDIVKAVMKKMNRDFYDLIGRESEPGLGNGGLGRLASCFLDSLSTLNLPSQAYGLRYQYGVFEQELWNGVQIEKPDCWLISENPWEFRRDLRKVYVKYGGVTSSAENLVGERVSNLDNFEEVWAIPYDIPILGYSEDHDFTVLSLRLWSTKESPRNFQLQRYNAGRLDQAAENTTLTDVLYPSDHHETGKRVRLKQEFLLVSASLQDIIRHYLSIHPDLKSFGEKSRIQINDTHASLVVAELMRILTKKYNFNWRDAWEVTQEVTSYTNHTVLKEALEEWEVSLMRYLLPRQFEVIERLNHDFCEKVRDRYPNDEEKIRRMSIIENGKVRMAHLAIIGSHRINGVAKLHSDILKETVFKDFYEMEPDKFINITNGVTHRRWLLDCNPQLADFISKRIGKGWITHFEQIKELASFASDPKSQVEFLNIKRKNKENLIEFLQHHNLDRNTNGQVIEKPLIIDPNSLFDVQIKRIHEYKRQLMNVLHAIMLFHELIDHPQSPRIKRTIIIGGKAAAGYELAKTIIRLIHAVARKINNHPIASKTITMVLVENYSVSRAEKIIPAADLSQQISMAGMEASGTGNMKLAINGALTLGTEDGANIEMKQQITEKWWPFSFGLTSEEVVALKSSGYNPWNECTKNHKIERAVNSLRDRSFALDESEHQSFCQLFHRLIDGTHGSPPDVYLVLKDLQSYYEAQKNVEKLYSNKGLWAEYALQNIAGMGYFSADRSIALYNKDIWHLDTIKPDEAILGQVREEYSEHDRCRIFSF